MSKFNKVFSEFIARRCEDLIAANIEYRALNSKILHLEKELTSKLDSEEMKIFLEYEQAVIEQLTLVKMILA